MSNALRINPESTLRKFKILATISLVDDFPLAAGPSTAMQNFIRGDKGTRFILEIDNLN